MSKCRFQHCAFVTLRERADAHKRWKHWLRRRGDLFHRLPERSVADNVTGAALNETVCCEVFEFREGLMALETVSSSLPLRKAETVLPVTHDFLQDGD